MSECRCTGEPCSVDCPGEPIPCPECCEWMQLEIKRMQEETTLLSPHNHTVQEVCEILQQDKPLLLVTAKSKETLAKWLRELMLLQGARETIRIALAETTR